MLQNAIVVKTEPESCSATVSVMRKTACGECAGRYLCGSARQALTEVNDPIGVSVGDAVEIEVPSESVLGYAALVFLAPVALALILYYALSIITPIAGYAGAAVGFIIPFAIARIAASKRGNAARPTVKRILPPAEGYAECDNANKD